MAHVMKDGIFNPLVDEKSGVIVLEEDMHDLTLNFMFTNLGWKDDESEPMTIKAELVKEAIGRSIHTMDLSRPDLFSSIPVRTSKK